MTINDHCKQFQTTNQLVLPSQKINPEASRKARKEAATIATTASKKKATTIFPRKKAENKVTIAKRKGQKVIKSP